MKKDTLKSINRSYHKQMKGLTSKGREKEILAALRNGKNTYMRIDRLGSSSFDSSWIEVIEDVIFDLGEIIANPRQVTKTDGNIVPIELARKVGAESVRHLASHTQYIKEIDEYGNVIPSKILTMVNEDDIKTYENRFIATFVRRLILFIEKRYEFVSKFAELHDEQILTFKNRSIVEGSEVEIETKIRINHKSDDELSLKSNEYVERIKQMRQYILYFYNSDFMHQLKTEKDVHNPILQTNIIRKNPLYHHCYEVYRFIERYEHLGVKYKVDEHFSVFNDTELAEINNTLFANYITLQGKERSNTTKSNSKIYKPKILTSIDDEQFIYGPRLAGPIEFVRVDEQYQKYLDSKVKRDLPLHPTKKEKEYYAEEYKDKVRNKEDLKQKEDLLKRINKEVALFNKQAAKIDEEREQARLGLIAQEKQIIKKEEDDMLSAAREAIIAASMEERIEVIKEQQRQAIADAKVVEPTHPYEEPVSYDEATLQIWPQIANAPLLRKEPVAEEPVQEIEPIKEEEVPEEVPATEEPSVEEPVLEAEEIIEEQPEELPEEEAQPEEEPIEEAPIEETVEETPTEETPVEEEAPVVEETPVVEEEPAQDAEEPEEVAIEEPIEEEAPIVEEIPAEEPVIEIAPADEEIPEDVQVVEVPVLEEEQQETPLEEQEQPKVEAPIKAPKPAKKAPKKEKKAPIKEAEPKAKEPEQVKEQETPVPVKQSEPVENKPQPRVMVRQIAKPREKIPGRFIVKLMEGYYISDNEVSNNKEDAKVFDDFNLAKDVKREKGGKIIKL